MRRNFAFFMRHGRSPPSEIKALPVSEFRALLRELHEMVGEEWAVPET